MITIEEMIPVGYSSVGELHGNISEALDSIQEYILRYGDVEDCKLFCKTQSLMVSLLMKQIHGYECTERFRKLQVKGLVANLERLREDFPSQGGKIDLAVDYFKTLF